MAVHDWTSVDAGTFHAFHTGWILHLSETLNGGLLPSGYYAMPEQQMNRRIADILTLSVPGTTPSPLPDGGGVAVVDIPPNVSRRLSTSTSIRAARRTLAIRHVSGHRIVALVEILSPANKDRAKHVEEFLFKAEGALVQNVNLLLIDLFPPGVHDPAGMHGGLWERFDDDPYVVPVDEPLVAASYVASDRPDAYVEHFSVGASLPDMPLFLNAERYINVPLEATYEMAFRGMAEFWRRVLEGQTPAP
ncbi:MAG: DUF4058 family protein [Planctomycetes bacterium]|nr:DUF4058 family protein [Planctomycetota bacterium]